MRQAYEARHLERLKAELLRCKREVLPPACDQPPRPNVEKHDMVCVCGEVAHPMSSGTFSSQKGVEVNGKTLTLQLLAILEPGDQ